MWLKHQTTSVWHPSASCSSPVMSRRLGATSVIPDGVHSVRAERRDGSRENRRKPQWLMRGQGEENKMLGTRSLFNRRTYRQTDGERRGRQPLASELACFSIHSANLQRNIKMTQYYEHISQHYLYKWCGRVHTYVKCGYLLDETGRVNTHF